MKLTMRLFHVYDFIKCANRHWKIQARMYPEKLGCKIGQVNVRVWMNRPRERQLFILVEPTWEPLIW